MKFTASNAPMQLRRKIHIGSFMDIVYLKLLETYCRDDIQTIISWNALGLFREMESTINEDGFAGLFNTRCELVNKFLVIDKGVFHYLDDTAIVKNKIFDIIIGLMDKGIVTIQEYEANYCESCDVFFGPISNGVDECIRCNSKLTSKFTHDLFITVSMDKIQSSVNQSTFYPDYTRAKFLGSIRHIPQFYPITKKRNYGFNVASIDPKLQDKVVDPKFVFSLYPIVLEQIGKPPLKVVIMGEDILAKYLYYVFANSSTIQEVSLDIYVHGLLTSEMKKISKYDNFPEVCDIEEFLRLWSWEHLVLLSMSAEFGKNIDIKEKMVYINKLLNKRKNVLALLHKFLDKNINDEFNKMTEHEIEIITACERLREKLSCFDLFRFFKGYADLWFNLLSRRYIPLLRKNEYSQNGLKKILTEIKDLHF